MWTLRIWGPCGLEPGDDGVCSGQSLHQLQLTNGATAKTNSMQQGRGKGLCLCASVFTCLRTAHIQDGVTHLGGIGLETGIVVNMSLSAHYCWADIYPLCY